MYTLENIYHISQLKSIYHENGYNYFEQNNWMACQTFINSIRRPPQDNLAS